MFRERRDDNEETARKRWRGATSGKEVCVENDREAAVPRLRASKRIDERRKREMNRVCVNGGWTERRHRDRSTGKQYEDIL